MLTRKNLVGALLAMAAMAFPAGAQTADPALVAAGRVRFVEGGKGNLIFQGESATARIDFLIPVGAEVKTGNGRLELQTLNQNLLWFGPQTTFNFEASDPAGDGTTLFLGQGSMVLKTRAAMTVITGSGSVYFPAKGTYSIEKAELGKKFVRIGTVSGRRPEVLRQATFFSRFKFRESSENKLVSWMEQREREWLMTLARANLASHVDLLPPMVAYTGADGKIHWRRVKDAGPIGWLQGQLINNTYLAYNPAFLRVQGLLSPVAIGWTDYETAVWFAAGRYNSVRWTWDVYKGWHAQWYYDPLAGFGAEFTTLQPIYPGYWFWCQSFLCAPSQYTAGPFAGWPFFGPRFDGAYWDIDRRDTNVPLNGHVRARRNAAMHPPRFLADVAFNPNRPVKVRLNEGERTRLRLRTDDRLRSPRAARRLDVRRFDIERARFALASNRGVHRSMAEPGGFMPRVSRVRATSGSSSRSSSRSVSRAVPASSSGGRTVRSR